MLSNVSRVTLKRIAVVTRAQQDPSKPAGDACVRRVRDSRGKRDDEQARVGDAEAH